jgi:hypothetical protein
VPGLSKLALENLTILSSYEGNEHTGMLMKLSVLIKNKKCFLITRKETNCLLFWLKSKGDKIQHFLIENHGDEELEVSSDFGLT